MLASKQTAFFSIFRTKEFGQTVCDLKAYLIKNKREELLLESVNQVHAEHGEVTLRNIFGEEKKVPGEIREVSLVKSRIVVAGT
jgi:predicted RNA-binding protein